MTRDADQVLALKIAVFMAVLAAVFVFAFRLGGHVERQVMADTIPGVREYVRAMEMHR